MCRCSFPDGYTIKPDGVHELDPCRYKDVRAFRNVTVVESVCTRCGRVDFGWYRQEDTEEIDLEDEEVI